MKKTALIIGAGAGMGKHVAEKFGREGFRIILIARNEEKLKQFQKELTEKNVETFIFPADVTDHKSLKNTFGRVAEQFGTIDLLVYNVGITVPDREIYVDSSVLLERYKADVTGAYECISLVTTDDFAKRNGAIIITGGKLAEQPSIEYLPLSMDKAALRAMVYAMHPVLKEKGIFLGMVTIMGGIRSGTHFSPEHIAETFWQLYNNQNAIEIKYE